MMAQLMGIFAEAYREVMQYSGLTAVQLLQTLPEEHYRTGWALAQVGMNSTAFVRVCWLLWHSGVHARLFFNRHTEYFVRAGRCYFENVDYRSALLAYQQMREVREQ